MRPGVRIAGLGALAALAAATWLLCHPSRPGAVLIPVATQPASSSPLSTASPINAPPRATGSRHEVAPATPTAPRGDARTYAVGQLRDSFYASQPYPLYVALRDRGDPASRLAARYLRGSCLSALYRLARVQSLPPQSPQAQAGAELVQRCQAIKDDPHQPHGPPPALDAPATEAPSRPAEERLRQALELGDFVSLLPAIYEHLRVHPYFEGRLLGGARSPEVFEAALELAFHQLHEVPGEQRTHLSQLIDCAVHGRCGSRGHPMHSSQGLSFNDPDLRSLAQRLQTAIEHRNVAAFLAGPGS